jgi:hypothetical protein
VSSAISAAFGNSAGGLFWLEFDVSSRKKSLRVAEPGYGSRRSRAVALNPSAGTGCASPADDCGSSG